MEEDFLEQIKDKEIDLVVCSDAEAILGIGDQGVGVSLVLLKLFFMLIIRQGIGVRLCFPPLGLL
jgi:malate dehydrogenase (oxaloacetate-decarboxylating)